MNHRPLTPGEVIVVTRPEMYCGRNGVRVTNIRKVNMIKRIEVTFADHTCWGMRQDGRESTAEDYQLCVITPDTPAERDWSEVAIKLAKKAEEIFESASSFKESLFAQSALLILQEADKVKEEPVKHTYKKICNIYDDGNIAVYGTFEDATWQNTRKVVARKEIEIEYTEGEGIDEK